MPGCPILQFYQKILTVQHGELLIAYDNRRLVSARWRKSNGDPQHEITCRIKQLSDELEDDDVMVRSFLFVWEGSLGHAGQLLSGHYLRNFHAARYGGLVAIRTASQGTNFPINGSQVLPTFGILKSAWETTVTTFGHLKFKPKQALIPVDSADIVSIPESAYFGSTRDILFPHPEFIKVFNTEADWFEVENTVFHPHPQ